MTGPIPTRIYMGASAKQIVTAKCEMQNAEMPTCEAHYIISTPALCNVGEVSVIKGGN